MAVDAVALVATVGSASANAYLTAAAARIILNGVPNSSAFDEDDAGDVAIVYATAMLDALAYQGRKTATTQALAFPRFGIVDPNSGLDASTSVTGSADFYAGLGIYLDSATIPVRVQRATALLALVIRNAGTAEVWGEDATMDIKRTVVGPLQKEYADRTHRLLGLRRYPSVWREIFPLTHAAEQRTVQRA